MEFYKAQTFIKKGLKSQVLHGDCAGPGIPFWTEAQGNLLLLQKALRIQISQLELHSGIPHPAISPDECSRGILTGICWSRAKMTQKALLNRNSTEPLTVQEPDVKHSTESPARSKPCSPHSTVRSWLSCTQPGNFICSTISLRVSLLTQL